MSDALATIIKQHIRLHGPMGVDTYWNLCLAHPTLGYYRKQDPLGSAGDFITAPEISQLFGEAIGIWVAMQIESLGHPPKVHVVECGPGRGTLMADILRMLAKLPDFYKSVQVHLIETSPVLKAKQSEALARYGVTWHDDISTVPDDAPVIIIGNEFLDALPIQQFIYTKDAWHERVIGISDDDALIWGLLPRPDINLRFLDHLPPQEREGKFLEFTITRERYFVALCERITQQRGMILMIDYGHDGSTPFSDTLQAVMKHQMVDVLSHQGDADLTSHVDFGRLATLAHINNLSVTSGTQANFLRAMSIEDRAKALLAVATPEQQEHIRSGLSRLLDDDKMGTLFRVVGVSSEKAPA